MLSNAGRSEVIEKVGGALLVWEYGVRKEMQTAVLMYVGWSTLPADLVARKGRFFAGCFPK